MTDKINNENLIYTLQGLAIGAGGMGLIQTLRHLNKLWKNRHDDQELNEIELTRKPDAPEGGRAKMADDSSISNVFDLVSDSSGYLWDNAIKPLGSAIVGEPAKDNFIRNALFLTALGVGGYGVKQVYDVMNKDTSARKVDDIKEYYYSRLLETSGEGDTDAKAKKTELHRKTANDGNSLLDILAFAGIFGTPLAAGYLTKKYLDETMPGSKQPSARNVSDPRAEIARVRRKEPDEDDSEDPNIKVFDGIGKVARCNPAMEDAFRVNHMLRILMANRKEASLTIIPDIIGSVENGWGPELRELAMRADIDGFCEQAEKRATERVNGDSTTRSRHLAIDAISADNTLRSVAGRIAAAEMLEQFPTTIKASCDMRPEAVETCMAFAKMAKLAEEDRLFGAQINENTSLKRYASQIGGVFSARRAKSASSDGALALNRQLFGAQ